MVNSAALAAAENDVKNEDEWTPASVFDILIPPTFGRTLGDAQEMTKKQIWPSLPPGFLH